MQRQVRSLYSSYQLTSHPVVVAKAVDPTHCLSAVFEAKSGSRSNLPFHNTQESTGMDGFAALLGLHHCLHSNIMWNPLVIQSHHVMYHSGSTWNLPQQGCLVQCMVTYGALEAALMM